MVAARSNYLTPRRSDRTRVDGTPRRRRRPHRPTSIGINLAPMIDVTFLLLIFFLVTTTFERAEGILTSDLPDVSGTQAVPLPISPIVVRLTQLGPGHDDYTITIDGFESAPNTMNNLSHFLREIQQQPGFDAQTPVVIVAQNDVRWDHIVACWNAALRANCEHIAFGQP